jgi:hypothetical protein
MKNQFYYNVKQEVETPVINGEAQPKQFKNILCSCNLDKVLFSIETPTGRTLVMDHMHEREYMEPVYNKKHQKIGEKKIRGMYQTEVILDQEESERFIMNTSVFGETLIKNVE